MGFEVDGKPLKEVILESARKTEGFDKKTLREIEDLCIPPVPTLKPKAIVTIRLKYGLSQPVMAQFLGVSDKTIKSWEQGRQEPSPMARRLLVAIDRHGLSLIT
jgi:putative transcriptional regulator